jgi:hypothetical protein
MPDFYLKKDDLLPDIIATLDGVETLVGASTVTFKFRRKGEVTVVGRTCTVLDATLRKVKVEWQSGDTTTPGEYYGEFEVIYAASSKKITFPNDGFIIFQIVDDLA